MLTFFLVSLLLSASPQSILPETQWSTASLRTPNCPAANSLDSQQNDKTVQDHPEISSEPLDGAGESTVDDEEFSLVPQRMLQGEPVLTSIQETTIYPPDPEDSSTPTVVTTETYVLDVNHEEEIIITVENNQDALEVLEALGNEQPQIVIGEDVFISSWWTIEDDETAFESWEQLESFLGTQYGSEPQTGIDVNAEDVPVEIEILVPEVQQPQSPPPVNQATQNINEDLSTGTISLTDIAQGSAAVDWGQYEQVEVNGVKVNGVEVNGVEVNGGEVNGVEVEPEENFLTVKPKCKQVKTCQRLFVRPIGFRNVCKNQLVCPKT